MVPGGVLASITFAAMAQAAVVTPKDLASLSIEELANLQVTSVSGRAERLSDAAASIYVVTGEAIRRSGATSLPEALRLAPNLQVARIDAGEYAISARGFNNAIANKLLVLIDGRTVYAPFFSGVFWDQQIVMLEDIDRIEVISGPGATLWGANAVNGVINVITRSAGETPGGVVALTGGNREQQASTRFGGRFGEGGSFRLYATTERIENTRTEAGTAVADGWDRHQAGFRVDWARDDDSITFQGDTYNGKSEHRGFFGPFELTPVEVSGANALARWSRRFADGSNVRVQAYYDHSERKDAVLYSPKADILDIEFQHGLKVATHQILWGAGHRRAHDDITPGLFFGFIPASRSLSWTSVFVQDEIAVSESVDLTLGTKLENNDYTGTERLPSARVAWKVSPDQLLWAAASRAVRAPARLDRDLHLPPNPPFIIDGGPTFVSEVANVVELGWRAQPTAALNYSVTAFHHQWSRLRSGQLPPNAQVQNMIAGKTYGAEAWGTWQATQMLRLSGGVTVLHKSLHLEPGSTDPVGAANLGDDPLNQWSVRAAFTLAHRQEFDVALRHVAALPDPAVPAYTAVDLRYGWLVRDDVELSVIGQNLFDREHPEFNAAPGRSEIGRSVALRIKWVL
jgi:iron complex outermembrane receptor protein